MVKLLGEHIETFAEPVLLKKTMTFLPTIQPYNNLTMKLYE
jgi:hypothetical protein